MAGNMKVGQTKKVRQWRIRKVSPTEVVADGPRWSDAGYLRSDGVMVWDSPERIPEYAKEAAYKAVSKWPPWGIA